MRRTLTRLTVAGSAAALCAGLAVPAFAGTHPADGSFGGHGASTDALTADQLKAVVDASIAHRLADLAEDAAKLAASTKLTDAQKAAAQARIQARVDALNALKAQVDADTTVADIKAHLEAYWLARLQAAVDARIAKRVAHLTAALAKVQASTTLTDAQKAAATAKIQTRIDALTALKAKVDAETTLAAAKADLRAARSLLGDRDEGFGFDGTKGHKGDKTDKGSHGKHADAVAAKGSREAKSSRTGRHGDHRFGGAGQRDTTRFAVTHGGYSTWAGQPSHGGHHH